MFSWSCNSLEVYVSAANDFRVRTKKGKQCYYKKRKQRRYLNIFNIINILTLLSADVGWATLLRVPSLTKVEVRNFPLLHFPRGSVWLIDNLQCLWDVWKSRSYANSNVSVSLVFSNGQFYLKYYFPYRRHPPPFKEIQLSVNCYVSVLIFHQNVKSIAFLYIYNTCGNVPKSS